jgi:hypothetical protein
MSVASDGEAATYAVTWIGLAVILAYYAVATLVVRWRPQRRSAVTRYEPPANITPALAAYLRENGYSERAFAAALVSLAAKGYLKIRQSKDWFEMEKLREPGRSLPPEESIALANIFPYGLRTYSFDGVDYTRIWQAYDAFVESVEATADLELISTHSGLWWCGIALSVALAGLGLQAVPIVANGTSLASLAYLSIWIVLGYSCLVAALRVWPSTLRKFVSFLPGVSYPGRPLNWNDGIPVLLTASALLGFAFLAVLTSNQFALLLAALAILNSVFRHLLDAPTRAGRRVLVELSGFREFLSHTDADRLNRENKPGHTPQTLEKYSAYAVALEVEQGWGEEFTENLLELLQIHQAYVGRGRMPPPLSSEIIQLKVNSRK